MLPCPDSTRRCSPWRSASWTRSARRTASTTLPCSSTTRPSIAFGPPVSAGGRAEARESLELILKGVRGPETGRVFRVAGRELVVGRGAGDVRLDDPEVSRHHLAFQKLAGRCLARDLGSTNGSHVDGLKVAEAFVAVGQEIAVGNTVLKIEAIGGAHPAG